jgi:uncharacterized protein (DUF2235 family)
LSKNIVLCSDGTGNQDIKNRGTNVFKLYEAVDIQGHKLHPVTKQVAFYDDGIGTRNAFAKVIGGAFGWGFSKNVRALYRELVNVYEPGDRIYLFGFSRGAYTVRALAGFIQYSGILDIDYYSKQPFELLTSKIQQCWDDFRTVAFKAGPAQERRSKIPTPDEVATRRHEAIERRRRNHAVSPEEKLDIAFIGVWDTVGAIAAPFDGLRELINFIYPIWFSDNTLGQEVARACHALALNEERRTFHPELWNEKNGSETRIKQVWFAGVHSNVGGGYPKQGMSLVSLDWMMAEAGNAGLRFNACDVGLVHDHQDVHDKLYDSRAGIGLYYRWAPRDVSQLCAEHKIARPKVHVSLFERIANGTDAYAPGNIPCDLEVDTAGSIGGWPAAAVSHLIPPLLKANYSGHNPSLLADMAGTVRQGKLSYYAFLLVSFATLATLADLAVMACTGKWVHLSWVLGAAIFFLCGAGLVYSWSKAVDCALCKTYRTFWHDCRTALRKML